jgi:hypothetical protein
VKTEVQARRYKIQDHQIQDNRFRYRDVTREPGPRPDRYDGIVSDS